MAKGISLRHFFDNNPVLERKNFRFFVGSDCKVFANRLVKPQKTGIAVDFDVENV